jgi:hypothetical protein
MKQTKLVIPLGDNSADEAVFNYVICRGLLPRLLISHFKPITWASESARIAHIAELVTPLLLPNTTLSFNAHGIWNCEPTPDDKAGIKIV